MTTPRGTLIKSITQNKTKAKATLLVYTIVTILIGIVFVGGNFLAGDRGVFLSVSLFITGSLALGVLIAGYFVYKPLKRLEIYEDGFILLNSKTNDIIESALWKDVVDIDFRDTKKQSGYSVTGELLFGFIGRIIVSLLNNAYGTDERVLFIVLPNKKIKIDMSYSDPELPAHSLSEAACDAWVKEGIAMLGRGSSITLKKVELLPTGISQKNTIIEWKSIIDAIHISDRMIEITWNNPAKNRQQTLRLAFGYRGKAVVHIVRQKIGKQTDSLASRLGTLVTPRSDRMDYYRRDRE